MADLETFLRSLASLPDQQDRAEAFEDVCLQLLRHEPFFQEELAASWRWSDWPGAWGRDAGIDIVGETPDGDLWAVQAKAYAPDYFIKKADVDSFLAESSRPGFTFRLLIATTDLLGPTAARTLEQQAVRASFLGRTALADLDLDWPEDVRELRPPRPQRRVPRQTSQEAVEAIVDGLGGGGRGQLRMACGTGKTLVGLWAGEALAAESVLVVLPSLALLAQTMREWRANGREPGRMLAVCGDASVAADEATTRTFELGVPVTTDATEIAEFLHKTSRRVIFSTYHSLGAVAAAAQAAEHRFSLVIVDEAHRCAGSLSGEFAKVLDDDELPAERRLFMTATPRVFTARARQVAQDDAVAIASMDDESLFGPPLYELPFSRAIELDLLTDYQVVVVAANDEELARAAERRALVSPEWSEQPLDLESLASLVAVARTIRMMGVCRLITFHSRIKSARQFAQRLPEAARWLDADAVAIHADSVDGQMPSSLRRRKLFQLAGGDLAHPHVLSNARCLAEGVDIPALDGVAFVDPKSSEVDIVQAVGRAIRRSDLKSVGTIILPVVIPPDAGDDAWLSSGSFANVWRVLRALRSHDAVLGEQLDALRRELGRRPNAPVRLPSKIRFDLPAVISAQMLRDLTVRLVEATTSSWEASFARLQEYASRNGTVRISNAVQPENRALALWISQQRRDWRDGRLDPVRAAQLEELPGWKWDTVQDELERGLGRLEAFVSMEGHALVPQQFVMDDGFRLGQWVHTVRRRRRERRLPPEFAEQLAGIPGWTWEVASRSNTEKLDAYLRFVTREGNGAVPAGHEEDGIPLGAWLRTCERRARGGVLGKQVTEALNAINPEWTRDLGIKARPLKKRGAWDRHFACLLEEVAEQDTARVPQARVRDGLRLGGWVAQQRRLHSLGVLEPERVSALSQLPGWTWSVRIDEWEKMLGVCRSYRDTYGPDWYRMHGEQGLAVRNWVTTQQRRLKSGRLPIEQQDRLDQELPGWRPTRGTRA